MPHKLLCSLALFICGTICAGCSSTIAAPPPAAPPKQAAASDAQPPDAHPAAHIDDATAQTPSADVTDEPADFVAAFDRQLIRIASDQPPQAVSSLPADQRELLETITQALAQFRRAAQDENALLAAQTAPLVALSDQLKSQAPLALPTLALCRSVAQFGVYETFEEARFTAGKDTPVIVYCEVDNFLSRLASDSRWETKLNYEAVLYNEGDHALPLIRKPATPIIDRCRNRRRDFFLADRMTIPASLPVGKYLLKVTVIDEQANRVAEKSVSLMVAPN